MTEIRIALPSKGRLADRARRLFEEAGLPPSFHSDRALVARLGDRYRAVFVRAPDIPEFLADGAAELGVTGADLVAESGIELAELLDLGFGRCRLVVAVRDELPARSPGDLAAGTRVATSFPRQTERYFETLGTPVEIAAMSGAVETAPHLGVADVVVDLTSTGSTLSVNGLREIGTIMESSARLCAGPHVAGDPALQGEAESLVAILESVLRAAGKRYLMANVSRDQLDQVRLLLPGISGPTVIDVLDKDAWVAVHAVVDAGDVFDTTLKLKALGAEGILVTRIERLMP